MLGVFILFRIILYAALLWFILVWVTQNHSHEWKEMILWTAIMTLIGNAGGFMRILSDSREIILFVNIIGLVAAYAFIYMVIKLRYDVENAKKRRLILVYYIFGTQLIRLVM